MDTETELIPYQDFKVKQILFHPHYHEVHQYYDVALLLLDRPAVLGSTVNTICLPSSHRDYLSDDCVASGWGTVNFDNKSSFQKVSFFKLGRKLIFPTTLVYSHNFARYRIFLTKKLYDSSGINGNV